MPLFSWRPRTSPVPLENGLGEGRLDAQISKVAISSYLSKRIDIST